MTRLLVIALAACTVWLAGSGGCYKCSDEDGDGHGGFLCGGGFDCDDNDPHVWREVDGYLDEDGDGVAGSEWVTLCIGSSYPGNYRPDAGDDCDDTDDSVWRLVHGYPDGDGDGTYASAAIEVCAGDLLPPELATAPGSDCDDSDPDRTSLVSVYIDGDGDGVGAGDLVDLCAGAVLTLGYSFDGSDCDDSAMLVWQALDGWADRDADGVVSDASEVVCTNGTLPTGYAPTAGTDCDDWDPYAADSTSPSEVMRCMLPGTCLDTEGLANAPDLLGVGACAGLDCNGASPVDATPLVDTTVVCDIVGDCAAGQLCFDPMQPLDPTSPGKRCWAVPSGCNSDPAGDTCAELISCIDGCHSSFVDPSGLASCVQFDCVEVASPLAQYLYEVAQTCATLAGCYGSMDPMDQQACIQQSCLWEFGSCLVHTP